LRDRVDLDQRRYSILTWAPDAATTFRRLIHGTSAEPKRIASVNCQKARPLSKANATAFGVAHGTPFALHQTRSEY